MIYWSWDFHWRFLLLARDTEPNIGRFGTFRFTSILWGEIHWKINLLQGVDGYPWNVFRIEAFDHGMSLPDAIPHAHNPSGSDSSVDHSFDAPPTIYYWHVLFSSRFPTDNPKQLLVPGVTPYCFQVQYSHLSWPFQHGAAPWFGASSSACPGNAKRLRSDGKWPSDASPREPLGTKKHGMIFFMGDGFMVKPC
jgi:hypothetical protein